MWRKAVSECGAADPSPSREEGSAGGGGHHPAATLSLQPRQRHHAHMLFYSRVVYCNNQYEPVHVFFKMGIA
jgi:hypothetical protein